MNAASVEECPRVLVVEDEPLLGQAISRALTSAHCRVDVVASAPAALLQLERATYDALIVDLYLPEVDGWRVLNAGMALEDPPTVIMMSGEATVHVAVEAMRRGAADFLAKPLDLSALASRFQQVLTGKVERRRAEDDRARRGPVAASRAMKHVFALADKVARSPSSVLILGESGVGKEVVAARIHAKSTRRAAPFIRVNLPAIPEALVEAELFGSVRGSFTDAKRDRVGLFASAHSGTILLDELCDFRIQLQAKLLRVLEERRFYAVGSDEEREVDVRVLAATNRDPEQAIKEGLLREDLYYRLATVVIHVPPLRERPEDILPLATHFLARIGQTHARPKVALSRAAQAVLLQRTWRGNARELRNALEQAVLLSDDDEIGAESLERESLSSSRWRVAAPQPPDPVAERTLAAALGTDKRERALIEQALRDSGGVRSRAAALLGISRTTLWEKIKRHGLE